MLPGITNKLSALAGDETGEFGFGRSVGNKGGALVDEGLEGTENAVKSGEFSILNWDGYPENIAKPVGPFRLIEGEEYDMARNQANNMNKLLHDAIPSIKGMDIHEIQPVKFGGSPIDLANKIPLSRQDHIPLINFWNTLAKKLK